MDDVGGESGCSGGFDSSRDHDFIFGEGLFGDDGPRKIELASGPFFIAAECDGLILLVALRSRMLLARLFAGLLYLMALLFIPFLPLSLGGLMSGSWKECFGIICLFWLSSS